MHACMHACMHASLANLALGHSALACLGSATLALANSTLLNVHM